MCLRRCGHEGKKGDWITIIFTFSFFWILLYILYNVATVRDEGILERDESCNAAAGWKTGASNFMSVLAGRVARPLGFLAYFIVL